LRLEVRDLSPARDEREGAGELADVDVTLEVIGDASEPRRRQSDFFGLHEHFILLFETTHATRRRIDAPNDSRDRSACLAPDQCSPSGGCWERLSQARHGVPCSCAGGRRRLSSGLPLAPAPVPRHIGERAVSGSPRPYLVA